MTEYDHIVGPNEVNTKISHAYIWVMPKSGTVFLSIFMNIYSELINTKYPSDKELQYSYPKISLFGKNQFVVEHAECPGFLEAEKDPCMRAMWSNITYSDSNWAGNQARKKQLSIIMAPDNNKNTNSSDKKFLNKCKIVFVYRNFLDQMISWFKHQRGYLPDNDPSNPSSKISLKELEKFIFDQGALNNCIKLFYSYHIVRKKYPNMILMVPYEEIMLNKKASLRRIINHLGIPYNEKAFLKAIEITSMDNMKALEKRTGHGLLPNQNPSYKTHIRNGGIGMWQSIMTPELVQKIELQMNQFGLSLNMFYIAEELDDKFNFLISKTPFSNKNKPKY